MRRYTCQDCANFMHYYVKGATRMYVVEYGYCKHTYSPLKHLCTQIVCKNFIVRYPKNKKSRKRKRLILIP